METGRRYNRDGVETFKTRLFREKTKWMDETEAVRRIRRGNKRNEVNIETEIGVGCK